MSLKRPEVEQRSHFGAQNSAWARENNTVSFCFWKCFFIFIWRQPDLMTTLPVKEKIWSYLLSPYVPTSFACRPDLSSFLIFFQKLGDLFFSTLSPSCTQFRRHCHNWEDKLKPITGNSGNYDRQNTQGKIHTTMVGLDERRFDAFLLCSWSELKIAVIFHSRIRWPNELWLKANSSVPFTDSSPNKPIHYISKHKLCQHKCESEILRKTQTRDVHADMRKSQQVCNHNRNSFEHWTLRNQWHGTKTENSKTTSRCGRFHELMRYSVHFWSMRFFCLSCETSWMRAFFFHKKSLALGGKLYKLVSLSPMVVRKWKWFSPRDTENFAISWQMN